MTLLYWTVYKKCQDLTQTQLCRYQRKSQGMGTDKEVIESTLFVHSWMSNYSGISCNLDESLLVTTYAKTLKRHSCYNLSTTPINLVRVPYLLWWIFLAIDKVLVLSSKEVNFLLNEFTLYYMYVIRKSDMFLYMYNVDIIKYTLSVRRT